MQPEVVQPKTVRCVHGQNMPPAKSRCGTCSSCRRRKGKCQTPKGKGKKSELEQLECAISPAAFRAPPERGLGPPSRVRERELLPE